MAEDQSLFVYEPLLAGHMRLLTIIDTETEGLLECRLDSQPIATIPKYAALSYVWGSDKMDKAIICNSDQVLVTTSLFEALTSLKKHLMDRNLPIWIDAVCINQANEAEKCSEIPHMDQIYRSAEVTIVWLGIVVDDMEEAIIVIPTLAEILKSVSIRSTIHWLEFEDYGLPHGLNQIWISILGLFRRPWFRRVWTFQETVLAKDIIFACGTYIIYWNDLYVVGRRLLDSGLPLLLGDSHGAFELTQIGQARIRYLLAEAGKVTEAFTLGDLIVLSKGRRCFEPRDRIYGLFSLVPPELRSEVPVSYSLDLGLLAQECGKICLRGSGRLHYLRVRALYSRSPTLPSWCLDLTFPKWNSAVQETSDIPFNETSPACHVQPNAAKVHIAGFRLDQIDNVSKRCPNTDPNDVQKNMRNALSFLEEGLLLAQKKYPEYLVPVAHVRAVMQNRPAEQTERQLRELYEEGVRFLEYTTSESTEKGITNGGRRYEPGGTISLWDAILWTCPGRVYITTACGHVGVAAPEVQVGDYLTVLQDDTEAVFAIREVEGPRTYEFAGEAYVDGLTGLDLTTLLELCVVEDIILA
jgi:hypothetical protein